MAEDLAAIKAECVQAPALRKQEHALAVQGEHDDGRAGDDGAEPFLTLAQLLLPAQSLEGKAESTADVG